MLEINKTNGNDILNRGYAWLNVNLDRAKNHDNIAMIDKKTLK